MPDGEIAVVNEGEEDILAIVRGSGPGETLAHRHSVEEGVHLLAELASLRIEGDLAEIVFLVFIVGRIVLLLAGHII